MSHICHALSCTREVPPKMFMCSAHWFMLPTKLRVLIWQYYEPGQEKIKMPSPQYILVAKNAVNWLDHFEKTGERLPVVIGD